MVIINDIFVLGKGNDEKKPKQMTMTTTTNETNTMLVFCYGKIYNADRIDSRKIHSTGVKNSIRNYIEQAYGLTIYIQLNRHSDKSIHMYIH